MKTNQINPNQKSSFISIQQQLLQQEPWKSSPTYRAFSASFPWEQLRVG